MNQVLYKFLKYFTFDQPSAICYSLTYSVDLDNYWIEKMKDILKYKVCVYSRFFGVFLFVFFTKMILVNACRHLIWVIKYFVVKQDFCTSDTAYRVLNNTHISFQGWNWSCRSDMDLQGWHRFLWCFLFCYKTKFHIYIKVKLWTWLDC